MVNKDRATWTIWAFPRKLKNIFVRMAKDDKKTVGELLEYLIYKYIRERKRKKEENETKV